MTKTLRAPRTQLLWEQSLAVFLAFRLRWAVSALFVLFVVSTSGYMTIEHFGLLDSAYMTVITLSTVGYAEVHQLDPAGRLFTIAVIVLSFGTFVYAAATLTNLFTSGDATRHLEQARERRMRQALSNHVIVVGFGRVGQAAAHGVRQLNRPCVVMERNPALSAVIVEAGYVPMIGDATSEADLVEAGIDRASALVAAAEEDATNLIVTLTARALRPELRIVSRVNEAAWQDRIERAGANVAQSPYRSYGMSLAASAVTSSVLDLHTIPELGLATEEIEVSAGSGLIGLSIAQVGELQQGVLMLGLRRDQGFQRWQDVAGTIKAGDIVIALGTPEAVRELAERT